mgnify:CR=1 FL=1
MLGIRITAANYSISYIINSELDTKSLDTKRAFGKCFYVAQITTMITIMRAVWYHKDISLTLGNARLHGKRAPDWIIRILGTDEDDSRALLRYENEKVGTRLDMALSQILPRRTQQTH